MPFPVDIKYIKETEQELDVLFPEKFKSKMLKKNGGELTTENDDWQIFPFFDKSDRKRLSRTSNHIILETNSAKQWSNFPFDGIAIASNDCGDLLVFMPAKENSKHLSEEIFIWLHETGEINKVAENIDELNEL